MWKLDDFLHNILHQTVKFISSIEKNAEKTLYLARLPVAYSTHTAWGILEQSWFTSCTSANELFTTYLYSTIYAACYSAAQVYKNCLNGVQTNYHISFHQT